MFRIAAFGDLATHTRPQLECSAVTKFGIEFSLDNIQYVSEIATVIRRIASAIFDQARPQLADGEGAPGCLSRFAEMESMWAPEHSHIPVPRGTPFPGGGDVPKPYYEVMDPFVVPSSQSTAWRRASLRALPCGGDLPLRLAGCQGKDLIVEGQRATLAASRFCNPSAPALTRWRCSGCLR